MSYPTPSSTMPDVTQLAAWLAATDIDLLEFTSPAGRIGLRRHAGTATFNEAAPAVASSVATPSTDTVVKANSPGIFLTAQPGRQAPLANLGNSVETGQMLGLIRVGALLLPVRAPTAGVLTSWSAAHGALVGFGTPLALLCAMTALSTITANPTSQGQP